MNLRVIHLTLLIKPPANGAKAPPERSTQLLAVQFHWCHAKGCRPWLRSEPCWWSMVLSGWLLQQQQMAIAPEFAVALCPLPWTWKRQSIYVYGCLLWKQDEQGCLLRFSQPVLFTEKDMMTWWTWGSCFSKQATKPGSTSPFKFWRFVTIEFAYVWSNSPHSCHPNEHSVSPTQK